MFNEDNPKMFEGKNGYIVEAEKSGKDIQFSLCIKMKKTSNVKMFVGVVTCCL